MEQEKLYQDIAQRTGGDIYIAVVGPVRSGKSTFIKRFVEQMLMPKIKNEAVLARTRDELPQSAAGRTIMTTEPKFVPESAVTVDMENGGSFNARLVDCVGYMVQGALGHEEDAHPRMVKSPWYDHEIPFDLAAQTGTRKVITEHSTIGIVMTTDGSISDIPREKYLDAEKQVVQELDELGKPFVMLLNSTQPQSEQVQELSRRMSEQYKHEVLPVNCLDLNESDFNHILEQVLYEFKVRLIEFDMPKWVTMLEPEHWLQTQLYKALLDFSEGIVQMKDVAHAKPELACEQAESLSMKSMDLASGCVRMKLELKTDVFYQVLGESTGLEICDEASLMPCVIGLARAKREYDKVKDALQQVEATGYGIVMPSIDELRLEEPEIVRQGGRYGVRLRASAPSIHLLKAIINTEISPIVGSEKQSEELVMSLLSDFEQDPIKIWKSNIFGKSLHELVNEGLQNKLINMPQEARARLQETVERVINEGCSGLICIIL